MGDLFRREAATTPEPFTGERLTAAIGGQVQIEHYHRYLFARALCHGRDVLDVASGEGYGTAQLAQVARSAVGVEFAAASVASASRNFPHANLTYVQGDARALPLADDCVDIVVSFETIEHFDRQDAFLAEIRRVLRPGGICVISTPDRDLYSGANAPANPYHVREMSRQEFADLLGSRFPQVTILRQRPMVGSALLADVGSAAPPLVFDRRGDTHFEACDGLPRAPYLVAVASDQALPPLPASLYIERSDLDTPAQDLQRQGRVLAEAEVELAALRRTLAEAEQRRSDLDASLDAAHSALGTALAAAEAARAAAAANERTRAAMAEAMAVTARELDVLRGSARTFLRHYLPRLRRHLLG